MVAVSDRLAVTLTVVFSVSAAPDIGTDIEAVLAQVHAAITKLLPSASFGDDGAAPVTASWRPIIEEESGEKKADT